MLIRLLRRSKRLRRSMRNRSSRGLSRVKNMTLYLKFHIWSIHPTFFQFFLSKYSWRRWLKLKESTLTSHVTWPNQLLFDQHIFKLHIANIIFDNIYSRSQFSDYLSHLGSSILSAKRVFKVCSESNRSKRVIKKSTVKYQIDQYEVD